VATVAVDLGASGGRVVRASWDGVRLSQQVVHRFANTPGQRDGRLSWDLDALVREIRHGIELSVGIGPVASVGVDTWGVDYGLLDDSGDLLAAPACYRGDPAAALFASRTAEADEVMYRRSGVAPMSINTVFQLAAESAADPDRLSAARTLLMTPDLVHHALCGSRVSEHTIASTTGVLDLTSRSWDRELIDGAGLPGGIFPDLVSAGDGIGELAPASATPIPIRVVAPACHDTADAVAAAPLGADTEVFLCTGTWFLVGRETRRAVTTRRALHAGLSNECGVGGRILTMANVTGLWLLEQCREQWAGQGIDVSYGHLDHLAASEPVGRWLFDPDCAVFDHPANMPAAIRSYCDRTGQLPPRTVGETTRAIIDSLAARCAQVISDLDVEIGPSTAVVMVGGGVRNELLVQAVADLSGLPVRTGPAEAASAGNGAIQLTATGELTSLDDIRSVTASNAPHREYAPRTTAERRAVLTRWQDIRSRGQDLGLGAHDDEGVRDGITRN